MVQPTALLRVRHTGVGIGIKVSIGIVSFDRGMKFSTGVRLLCSQIFPEEAFQAPSRGREVELGGAPRAHECT